MGIDTAMVREGADRLEGASVVAQGVLALDEGVDAVDGRAAGRPVPGADPPGDGAPSSSTASADRDRWIAGMQRLQRDVLAQLAGAGPAAP